MTLNEDNKLNLPEAPEFYSHPPQFTVSEMVAICEQMLPYWNKLRLENPPPPFVGESFRFKGKDLTSPDLKNVDLTPSK